MRQFFSIAMLSLFLAAAPLCAQPKNKVKAWTPAEMMEVKRISGVQVSPDGRNVVFAVREALVDAKSEYRTHIHLSDGGGPASRALTQGETSCDQPQWSPDGKWIAYLSTRTGKRQLWLISPKGGEPTQLTRVKTGVNTFKWAPDSKQIAFTGTDAPTPLDVKAKEERNDARVLDENFKMSRLYVVPVSAEGVQEVQLLTKGEIHIPTTGRAGYDWSPDCKQIVYTRTKTPLADDWTTADLELFEIATGKTRPLLPAGPVRYAPHFSPDGKMIAFVESPRTWAGAGNVHVHSLGTNTSRPLAQTFDGWGRYSELLGWSAESDKVYFTEVKGPHTCFGMLMLDDTMRVTEQYGFAATGIHLNSSRSALGMSWESGREAPEPAMSRLNDFKPVAVAQINKGFPILPPGLTEPTRWKSKDGLEIEGLLTFPANYQEGKRYPLLVVVHGGPMGVFTDTYIGSPGLYPIGAFSSRGYLVLRPNPRGSSGYGKKFRYANYGDWGGGDYRDIMAGVDHVIGRGLADPDKLGVMGWSYGGFMTSWIVTQTHRFKAASVGAGVTNLMSFTGTADIPSFLPDYFGGEFWDKFDAYKNHCAMFYVKGVKTPTLIQHGEKDERVPLSQGLEFYNALKRQGVTTKMVIYPRTPHSIEEPRLLLDCMERNLAWFDRYVGGAK